MESNNNNGIKPNYHYNSNYSSKIFYNYYDNNNNEDNYYDRKRSSIMPANDFSFKTNNYMNNNNQFKQEIMNFKFPNSTKESKNERVLKENEELKSQLERKCNNIKKLRDEMKSLQLILREIDYKSDYKSPYNRKNLEQMKAHRKECGICKDKLRAGEDIIPISCGDIFHSGCLSQWICKETKCPNCNKKIYG